MTFSKSGPPIKIPAADNIVAQTRRSLGLSQARLAAKIKTTPRAVSLWENGERPISGPVELLCKLLLKDPSILDNID